MTALEIEIAWKAQLLCRKTGEMLTVERSL
jgi:hypothetical protein